ncbi:polymorphic toxin type 4 domain-containing protein [Pseudovibrio denitrificans]|nr:polymorphic toxin type 4 domain-containing protein [Pseudovibrio denitrificans]
MTMQGVEEIVGPDGTKIVNMAGQHFRLILLGLKGLRDLSVKLVRVGTGPAVRRIMPGGKEIPRIVRRMSKDAIPYEKMTYETRLTGGIREAIGWLTKDRAVVVELGGYIGKFPGGGSKFRKKADFSKKHLKRAGNKAVGKWRLRRRNPKTGKMESYQRSHLWGFIFGDEARDGIMYAPAEFNQFWQSKRVEARIRELAEQATALKGKLVLRARAESYSPGELAAAARGTASAGQSVRAGQGEYLLKKVTYELMIESPQKPGIFQPFTELVFEIPPPWRPGDKLKMPSLDKDLPRLSTELF